MNEIDNYLYNNKKTIHYPNYIDGHNAINLIRENNNITINIKDVTITLPKEAFDKMLENKGGVVTINKQQCKLNKLKTSDHIDLTIRDEFGNIEKSKIKTIHFNVSDWHQFKFFIQGYTPIMILSMSKETSYGSNEIRDEIGFGITPYNLNSKKLDHIFYKENGYHQMIDNYIYEFDLNKNKEYNQIRIENMIKNINLYLKICEQPIVIQNLENIEKVLGIEFPKERIYNIDNFISFDDYEFSRKHKYSIDKRIFAAGGSPHQNALTLGQMYFDKEILKNDDNNLDKLIKLNEEIKHLEPILDFNI